MLTPNISSNHPLFFYSKLILSDAIIFQMESLASTNHDGETHSPRIMELAIISLRTNSHSASSS